MGHILPALGFGILLTFLPIEKWWTFFVLGFVMFAYLNVPLLGIALAALAIVLIYFSLKPVEAAQEEAEEAAAEKVEQAPSPVTHKDLVNAMWRHNLTLQLSWNYERMQALGFAWSISPILKKVYPNKDATSRRSSGTWCSTTPIPPLGRRLSSERHAPLKKRSSPRSATA